MNKKGFTLIELLAVIVILAIIALIAVPIVLNMIENARKSAAKSSTYGYIQAIDDNNELYEMNDDYDLTIEEIKGTNIPVSSINLKIKGKKPTSGTVTIDAKGRVSNATLCINNYTVTYNGTEATVGNKGCGGGSTPAASPVSFATDDWSIIAANTTSNVYQVGNKKTIQMDLNEDGENETYHIVIVNKTACTTETSETACGLVLQFEELLNTKTADNEKINAPITSSNDDSSGTNVGGWPASAMRTYLNTTVYGKLPSELQSVIINTTVISGHGSTSGETNFTSVDKLYLLSSQEVGLDLAYDSAKTETRKLDYYDEGTGDDAKVKRIKQYNGSNKEWWLRSANSNNTKFFILIGKYGDAGNDPASKSYGISPAFRVGVDS